MKVINIEDWNRKQHFKHFMDLLDPYFAVTIPLNVNKAYHFSKNNDISFFAKYLHDSMKAINDIKALKLRILDNEVVEYDIIHASATILRNDKTFGFSFIEFHEDLNIFVQNIAKEKERINATNDLYPPKNGLDCIHCSAMPWLNFSGHKEPISKIKDSVPKLAFSKVNTTSDGMIMNISVHVNHALVDGYDVALFSEKLQYYLDN